MSQQPCGRFEWERLLRRTVMPLRRTVMPLRIKFLAFMLASYADADGSNVRPGVERLADVTGLGTATVKRSLKVLRDEYGLLQRMKRGGGRGGTGSVALYRLTVPQDLLDRVELLSPDERHEPYSDHPGDPSVEASVPVDNSERGITQVIPQSNGIGITQVIHENGFHGSELIPHSRLRDQNERLRDRPGDPLPKTNHLKDTTTSLLDVTTTSARGEKCGHGLPARLNDDGTPQCHFCRRSTREAS